MKIEVIEPGGFRIGRELFAEGDRRTVEDNAGAAYCARGWAKDLDGNVATGKRVVNAAVNLEIDNAEHGQDVGEI